MYKYYYLVRPPNIGCQPDGYDSQESFVPRREVNGRLVWGTVTYPRRLTADEVYRYDLAPTDIKEQAELVFAREPARIKKDYLKAPKEQLLEFLGSDFKAWAALVLRNELPSDE